jgi:AraC-like DNA-binding protein
MKWAEVKNELQSSIGSLLTNGKDGILQHTTDVGHFFSSVESFEHFTIIQRNFETRGESLSIPFSNTESGIQMIFSFDGHSFFNRKHDPFVLSPSSHCLNFFNRYNCTNLLDERSRQHDITFRLKKSFYTNLIAQHLFSVEDRLPTMIAQEQEFNTINQHLPTDAAVHGILTNIRTCPFSGEMKKVYLQEHLRALLMLQIFHFNTIVTGRPIRIDGKITARDREILQEVKAYIDQHFILPASLEVLSRQFGLNEFKLKHGFKMLFDTSPMRYLQQKRLTYARTVLRDTHKTIKEVSDEIGYTHAANFSTAFTKLFGYPPQHYRKNIG